jgi:cell pole-organizing protein PopZ
MTNSTSGPARSVLFLAWPTFDTLECGFWQRLGDALDASGLRLVLASPQKPPADLGVAHVAAAPPVDAFWRATPPVPAVTLADLKLDAAMLLEREEISGSPAVLPLVERHRRAAMEATADYWFRMLASLDPAAVVIWNGQHVGEVILDAVCRWVGVPLMYVERAPVANAMFADDVGISVASRVARMAEWTVDDDRWRRCADVVIDRMASGQHTWWEQPESRGEEAAALRTALGIPHNVQVVLFASQVDGDTQQYLFAPHFSSNEAAFRWFLDQVKGRADVFVLGKQHPRCPKHAAFARALAESGVSGQWRSDVSIDDALTVADRVVAVNSTVLYEALARQRPVLSMGGWLLSGREAAYEVSDLADASNVIDAWLRADGFEKKQHAWREALAFLLSRCLYTYDVEMEEAGMLGARDLAMRIAAFAASLPQHRLPERVRERVVALAQTGGWLTYGDEDPSTYRTWSSANSLRYQLLNARSQKERGRRVMVWGAGEAGRITCTLLARIGVNVDAFISSLPGATRVLGRPLLSPDVVVESGPGVFVLVASLAHQQIVPTLTSMGASDWDDFVVLDCNLLVDVERDLTGAAGSPLDGTSTVTRPELPADARTTAVHPAMC